MLFWLSAKLQVYANMTKVVVVRAVCEHSGALGDPLRANTKRCLGVPTACEDRAAPWGTHCMRRPSGAMGYTLGANKQLRLLQWQEGEREGVGVAPPRSIRRSHARSKPCPRGLNHALEV